MKYWKTISLLLVFLSVGLWFGVYSRGPEGLLIGQWRMDFEATKTEIENQMAQETDAGSAAQAFGRAFLEASGMQRREITFNRDGTVRAVIRGDPEQIPWPGGGTVLREEQGTWQAERVSDDVLKVQITGGEREFADWQAEIHFENNDRFYYYTGREMKVREYWNRD